MRLPKRLTVAALPLAILGIAGCGGGNDSGETAPVVTTTPTTTALTQEELIAQGDAICAEVNAAVGSISAGSTSGAGGQAAQTAGLYVGMVESLKRLGTPTEADGYAEFSAAADELSQVEGEVKLAAERADSGALSTAESKAASALASFQSAAQSYGFEDCGQGPSAPAPSSSAEAPSEEEAVEGVEEEVAPEEVAPAPEESGGAGSVEAGGGAETGGGTGGGESTGGGSSGGIGPG